LIKKFRRRIGISSRRTRRRNSTFSSFCGRNIRFINYRKDENILAPIATIKNVIFKRGLDFSKNRLKINSSDFKGWQRLEFESITLILLIDVSSSTFLYIDIFSKILQSLVSYFNKNKDRIGLISLQGKQARILNHPTHNYKVILKSLKKLEIHGQTPLADGLIKSLSMAKIERYKKQGSKSLVILLSDCYPEPITGKYGNIFNEPAYIDTMNAASLFKKKKVSLILVKPTDLGSEKKAKPGEKLAQIICERSGGKILRLKTVKQFSEKGVTISMARIDFQNVVKSIEESFFAKG